MQYLITDSSRPLFAVDVPVDDIRSIVVERADQPGLLYAGLDLHPNGTVTVGHWPNGEDWVEVLDTTGVPSAYGPSTLQPAPVPLLDPHDVALLVRLLQTAIDQRTLPGDQHEQAAQLLHRLTPRS
ncbi:hypothetical protein ACFRR6_24200 [Streptomyces sp. NPDC056891]|uniref:hypothetical protein n=1 Tax=Streptomyces sp. NPDC056891 TaxID=3345961 RepID=UPI0036AAE178